MAINFHLAAISKAVLVEKLFTHKKSLLTHTNKSAWLQFALLLVQVGKLPSQRADLGSQHYYKVHCFALRCVVAQESRVCPYPY